MKLSVIMPIYNAADYLKDSIHDLLNQSCWQNKDNVMEIILVNDASSDNSLEIIEKIRKNSVHEIRLINLDENYGPGGARNAGIDAADGDYIGFMDADDRIDVNMYEKLLSVAIAENYVDYVDSGVWSESDGTCRCYSFPALDNSELNDELRSRLLLDVGYIWSRIYRREFLLSEKIRFREHVVMEDHDFLCEVIAKAKRIAVIPEVLYRYLDIPGSASKKNAEVEFFHSTIETIQASYNKLSKIDNYQGIHSALEYNFWQLYLMNVQTIDAYVQNEIIDENVAIDMLKILKNLMNRVVSGKVENNSYALERMDRLSIEEINKHIV